MLPETLGIDTEAYGMLPETLGMYPETLGMLPETFGIDTETLGFRNVSSFLGDDRFKLIIYVLVNKTLAFFVITGRFF